MRGKTSVLFGIVAFIPDNRELFGNESNKKKNPYSNTDFLFFLFSVVCVFIGVTVVVIGAFKGSSAVFLDLTFRGRH